MKSHLRILIIDDSTEDRLTYKRLLSGQEEISYEFIEADNGEDGIELFKAESPDCTLLDYNISGMTGFDVLSMLRETYPNLDLPIVMLTGEGNEKIAVKAMKMGAQDYLSKSNLSFEGLYLAIDKTVKKIALQRKAKELESIKSDFLSTASHELRTPLTIIKEFISLVRDEVTGPITVEQKECLTTAYQNCNRLGNLINDVLDLQRIEAGNPGLHRSQVKLTKLLDSCGRGFLLPYYSSTSLQQLELSGT